MKIEKSTLDLSSSSAETTVIKTTQQLEIQTGTAQQNGPLRMELDLGAVKGTKLKEVKMFEIPEEDKSKIRMLNKMLEAMTGKKMRFYIPEKYMTTESEAVGISRGTRMQFGDAARSMGWGIRYQSQETIVETAEMSFSAAGVVKTADGRTIDIDLQLNLSRSFSTTSLISFSAGNAAIDPLVVNFDGPSASLTTQKYSFDLDQDGTDENISFVGSGSGFLVLDKNLNGLIDNGGEMFGPSSGAVLSNSKPTTRTGITGLTKTIRFLTAFKSGRRTKTETTGCSRSDRPASERFIWAQYPAALR